MTTKEDIRGIVEDVLEEVEISFKDEDVRPAVKRLVEKPISEMEAKLDEFKGICTDSQTHANSANDNGVKSLAMIEELTRKVEKAIAGGGSKAVAVRKALSSGATIKSGSVVRDTLSLLAVPREAPEAGLMFLGTQGTSKTYECRRHGNSAGFDHFIEVGCSNGMESIDLLGGVDPGRVGKGDAWKDGPIAEAYRLAGTDDPKLISTCAGTTSVMLLIDEINRMPGRERSLFLNSMSPDSHIGGGIPVYKLRTGRAVLSKSGVLAEEIIYVPCQNLSIVATGNVGMEFDTYDDDPAGRERWIERSVQPDTAQIEAIIKGAAKDHKSLPKLSSWLMGVYTRTTTMKDDGLLRGAATIRTLTRIIQLLPEKASTDDFRTAVEVVSEGWISWDADGRRNAEQAGLLKSAIETAISGK